MRATNADYSLLLRNLRPRGPAWPAEDRFLDGQAVELARVHNRALDLLDEADPRSSREMLADWEEQAGLPDDCSAGIATTLQERRAAVTAKLTSRGGSTIAFFEGIAAALGYAIEIAEFRPFIAGLGRCGDRLNGPPSVRFYLRIRVTGPRVTLFRAGASQAGDRLGKIARAEDLECRIGQVVPAHLSLIFSYEGV